MTVLEEFRNNPFRVLGASPRDSRAQLISRQAEAALFDDSRETDAALAKLLHPLRRLRAEIRWFPMTEPDALGPVMAFLRRGAGPVPRVASPSALAQFNALRLGLCARPGETAADCRAAVYALAVLADALYPGQIVEEINEDRAAAGFARLYDTDDAEAELRQLLAETAAFCAQSAGGPGARALSRQLEQDYKRRDSVFHNSYLIELAARAMKK